MSTNGTGAALLASLLAAEGVTHVCGVLDDSVGDLHTQLGVHGIQYVPMRTEASAVHAAAAHAHVRTGLAVAVLAGGRGALRAVAAMADASSVGASVMVVSTTRGAMVTGPVRPGAPDAVDATRLTGEVVRSAVHCPAARRLPELFAGLTRRATGARPGVVHLQVPDSVMGSSVPDEVAQAGARPTAKPWRATAPRPLLAEAAGMLVRAERPLVHVGRGALLSHADQQVRELVAMLDAALTSTFSGRGILPEHDRHVIAPVHLSVVDDARTDADVVLVLGADLGESDWWGAPPHWGEPGHQRLIHVDSDPDVPARHRHADVAIVGDAATVLSDLLEEVAALGERDTTPRRHWLEDLQSAVRRNTATLQAPLAEESLARTHPAAVVTAARVAMPEDTTWVLDGHHTRRWAQFHLTADRPRSVLGDGPLAMAGAGMALGMGARLANPNGTVCCLVGNGAMAQQLDDIAASVALDLPMVVVVLADDHDHVRDEGTPRTAPDEVSPQDPASSSAGPEADGAEELALDDEMVLFDGEPTGAPDDDMAGDAAADADDRESGDATTVEPEAAAPPVEPDVDASADGDAAEADAAPANRAEEVAATGLKGRMSLSRADQVRFDLVARALGAWGEFVDEQDELVPALERALQAGRTAVVHVEVDGIDHVWTPEAPRLRRQRETLPPA